MSATPSSAEGKVGEEKAGSLAEKNALISDVLLDWPEGELSTWDST